MKAHPILFIILAAFIGGCRPKPVYGCTDPKAANYDPRANSGSADHCLYFGQAIFWQRTNNATWTITISDRAAIIDSAYATAPDCGTTGCATFSMVQGSYIYEAETPGLSLSGKLEVLPHGCVNVRMQ